MTVSIAITMRVDGYEHVETHTFDSMDTIHAENAQAFLGRLVQRACVLAATRPDAPEWLREGYSQKALDRKALNAMLTGIGVPPEEQAEVLRALAP